MTPTNQPNTPSSSCEIKVSGICLTKNRRKFLPLAIADWQRQIYPSDLRELLIVNDDGAERIDDLIPLDDQSIRLISVPGVNIGRKRNQAIAQATGEIIVHWDDDDRAGPTRIAEQVDRLVESRKMVTGYHEFRGQKISFDLNGEIVGGEGKQWIYSASPGYSCGAGLMYWKSWWTEHPFVDAQIGEDNAFVFAASGARQIITSAAGEEFICGVHGGNTCPKTVGLAPWREL